MSIYRKITTKFTDGEKLAMAVRALNLSVQSSPDLRENSLTIRNIYSASPCALLVANTGAYNVEWGGVGFAWNGSEYEAIYDHMTSVGVRADKLLTDLRQQYARLELYEAATLNGYTVSEERAPDGSILLTLNGGY